MVSQLAKTYPRIPDKVWWGLRRQFMRAMPTAVSTSYLETILKVTTGTARQILSNLEYLGLVDSAGKPTPLANDWRHDASYAAACEQMLTAVYPQELRDIASPPEVERSVVQDWFARKLMTGSEAARQMGAVYVLLAEADPAGEAKSARPSSGSSAAKRSESRATSRPVREKRESSRETGGREKQETSDGFSQPQLQIAIQVNIDPAMSPEQIEAVFASMKKHFYQSEG